MEQEIWKDIEGFENYQISSFGRVKSLKNNNNPKILKPNKVSIGYYQVTLSKNKIQKQLFIHRLVGNAFIPNPENKPQINHKNGIKTDNNVTNLEWTTAKQNTQHAWQTGLCENVRKNAIKAHEVNKKPIYSKKLDMRFESGVDAAKYIQSIYFENTELEHLKKGINALLKGRRQTSIYDYGWSYINN